MCIIYTYGDCDWCNAGSKDFGLFIRKCYQFVANVQSVPIMTMISLYHNTRDTKDAEY